MSDKNFELIQHDNGVNEMMFYVSSREAVDESVAAIDKVLAQRDDVDTEPLLLLSNNIISGDEPIAYATNAYRKLVQKHGIDSLRNGYLALVYREGMMMSFWMTLFSTFRMPVRIRTFKAEEYDDAIDWLITESKAD